jgi:tRNA pseudouridine55 synthase
MGHDKTYRAEIALGIETATYDEEGEVLSTVDASHVSRDDVITALSRFVGLIEQIPPMYSAIKQGGRKLYDIARAGKTAELVPRPVTIHSIDIERISNEGTPSPSLVCTIRCSAGTYIRSIAHDLGVALGTGAHLSALERTSSGTFRLEDALSLESLSGLEDWSQVGVLPLDAMYDFPRIALTDAEWDEIAHGRAIAGEPRDATFAAATHNGGLCAIVRADSGQWHPHKVFLYGKTD